MMKVCILLVLTNVFLANSFRKFSDENRDWDLFLDKSDFNELAFLETEEAFQLPQDFSTFLEMSDEDPLVYRSWLNMTMGLLEGLQINVDRSAIEACPFMNKDFFLKLQELARILKESSLSQLVGKVKEIKNKIVELKDMNIIRRECINEMPQEVKDRVKEIKSASKVTMIFKVVGSLESIKRLADEAYVAANRDDDMETAGKKLGELIMKVIR